MSAPQPPQPSGTMQQQIDQLQSWVAQLWCCCCDMQSKLNAMSAANRVGNTRSQYQQPSAHVVGRSTKRNAVSSIVLFIAVTQLSGIASKNKAVASSIQPIGGVAIGGSGAVEKAVSSAVIPLSAVPITGLSQNSKSVSSTVIPIGGTPATGLVSSATISLHGFTPTDIDVLAGSASKSKGISSTVTTLP